MRLSSIVLASFAACAVLSAACSVTTNGNSATITAQKKYVGPVQSKSATWDGTSVIQIQSGNGDVTVTASADATSISVQATAFAFADGDKQADGDAAVGDVQNTITVSSATSGQVTIRCSQAAAPHGSAAVSTTGCDLVVTVPAGTATGPENLQVGSENGTVNVSGITGSVNAKSPGAGDVTASVVPTKGSVVTITANAGNATLSLPSDFAADAITLSTDSGNVASDFSDVTKDTKSRGPVGTGAASITVTTSAGDVTLKSF